MTYIEAKELLHKLDQEIAYQKGYKDGLIEGEKLANNPNYAMLELLNQTERKNEQE